MHGPRLVTINSCDRCDQLFVGQINPTDSSTLGVHCRLLGRKIADVDSNMEFLKTPIDCPLLGKTQ